MDREKKSVGKELRPNIEDKAYLQPLFQRVKEAYASQSSLRAQVLEQRPFGFLVKVEGLEAYLPFKLFAWSYKRLDHCRVVSEHLKGQFFMAKVCRFQEDPLNIVLDAQSQYFEDAPFEVGRAYKVIVLQRSRHGLIVEMGWHFDWRYGSVVALAHKSKLRDFGTAKDEWMAGDATELYL